MRIQRGGCQQHLGEDHAGEQRECSQRRPAPDCEPAAARGVDDLRPEQKAAEEEARVLDLVERGMRERRVVGRRDVPGAERDRPDPERHTRPEQE